MKYLWTALFLSVIFCDGPAAAAQTNLLNNPGFEQTGATGAPAGWSAIWSRDPGTATMEVDQAIKHSGDASIKVISTGQHDWSVAQIAALPVHPGEIFTVSGWIRCDNDQSAEISVVTRDAAGNTLNWSAGASDIEGTADWCLLSSHVLIPPGCSTIQYRFIGTGPGTVWLDDTSLTKLGDLSTLQARYAARPLSLENRFLKAEFNPESATVNVTDKRSGRTWRQFQGPNILVTQSATVLSREKISIALWDLTQDLTFHVTIELPADMPQLRMSLEAEGPLNARLAYPQPFTTGHGDSLAVPMNEGMLYPADDPAISTMQLQAYCGHGGLSMPWLGICGPRGTGLMMLLRTPDDAEVNLDRDSSGNLYPTPIWISTKGQFGYARKLTYIFFDRGGYVAQAKWYREYAKSTGLFKSLAEKRRANPNVDLLIGAADIWDWLGPSESTGICREMKALGMDNVLWSSGGTAQQIADINNLGYLTGVYDQYQDLYPPNGGINWGTLHGSYPDDLEVDSSGQALKGWLADSMAPDGTVTHVQAGVCNSERAIAIAHIQIPADLKSRPLRARFLDTDTASPWREDYSPLHPLTRSSDRRYRMGLLAYCSEDQKLVTGSETGIDPAVPNLDYFEGMMSIAAYRTPDSGRNMQDIVAPSPDILKYQVGPEYRVPLFELVYHDCVVDYWYWGDYTNKEPTIWTQRDLFNILYATPPEFMYDSTLWNQIKGHIAESCKTICPIARKLGYTEMLSHAFLTPDHTVQQTRWANGTVITINLGDKVYRTGEGKEVKSLGYLVLNTK